MWSQWHSAEGIKFFYMYISTTLPKSTQQKSILETILLLHKLVSFVPFNLDLLVEWVKVDYLYERGKNNFNIILYTYSSIRGNYIKHLSIAFGIKNERMSRRIKKKHLHVTLHIFTRVTPSFLIISQAGALSEYRCEFHQNQPNTTSVIFFSASYF